MNRATAWFTIANFQDRGKDALRKQKRERDEKTLFYSEIRKDIHKPRISKICNLSGLNLRLPDRESHALPYRLRTHNYR